LSRLQPKKVTQKKKEFVTKAAAEKEHIVKENMVKVEESTYQHSEDKAGTDVEGGKGEEKNNPFKLQRWTKKTTSGPRKKQKSDKHAHMDPRVLTEGNLDDIRDKVCDTMTELCQKLE